MPTLNIRNVPERLYRELEARARRDRRTVPEQVLHLLDEVVRPRETGSILELKGLGKERWGDIDPAAYVDQERESWK